MAIKKKRKGYGLGIQTKTGKDGYKYLFMTTPSGSHHAFVEVETKEAIRQCGVIEDDSHYTTRTMGKKLGLKR